MKLNKLKILTIIPFLFVTLSFSQNHIRFNHLDVEDGLSQSVVTCILQDDNGFMWFGTQDGLNRYDGYSFKIFRNDPNDPNSLKDNFIFSIYQSNDGPLYFETQQGNFHLYDPINESFKVVNKDSVDIFNTRYNSVSALYIDPKGIIWKGGGSRGTGLTRENKNTGEIKTYKHDPLDKNSISSDRVYSIYRDSKGNLWVGTYGGLDVFDEETDQFKHFNDITDDQNNLPANWVWPIFEDSKGIIWFGAVREGLNRFDPKSKSLTTYKNISTNPSSLSHNFLFSIYEDRSGVIWIGTNTGSINYFHPSNLAFQHFINDPQNANSLNNNEVLSAMVDKDGKYWIGTRDGGINILDYEKKKFESIGNNPKDKSSLLDNSIQTIYQSRKGIIWIGTQGSGLDSYDPKRKKFTHYVNRPSDPNSLSDNRVFALMEDKNGIIWIGTYRGGLNRLDPLTGKIKRYQFKEDDSTSISSNATWSLTADSEGKLWIGTFGGGVNVFDPITEKSKRYQYDKNDSTSLPDNNIVRVFKDSQDNIWIGTVKGLSKYVKDSDNFVNYNTSDGLPNDVIYGILEDNYGKLWLSTNNGLSSFDPSKLTFKNFYSQDGLQGNEFNQNAFAIDRKRGLLLFGGLNGFNIFNPDSIKNNNFVPPIVLSEYIRFNSDDEEGKPIIEKGTSEIDSVFLTHKENIINFKFAALSYHNNEMNQYRYKLEGFNENWIQLGNNRSITFTNLSPGEYFLKVIGSNNDGLWNEEGKIIYVEVSPPWWRSNIAYILYVFAIIGFLLTVRKVEKRIDEQKAETREYELLAIAAESENKALQAENDRKSKELEDARNMQLSMLPKEIPKFDDVEIAAFMRTATEVGGDYYDFLVSEGTLNIAFGDATGHGLKAGTMVTLIKGMFTSLASKLDIKSFMDQTNKAVKEIKLGRIMMAFTFLKLVGNKIKMSGAGMPPVYLYRKATSACEEIILKGMPLGAMFNAPFYTEERELSSGDCILLFSDGLPEQINSKEELYDYPRVLEKFSELAENEPQKIIDELVRSCDDWMEGAIQYDDITFIVLKLT